MKRLPAMLALVVTMVVVSSIAGAQAPLPFRAAIAISESIQVTGTSPCFLIGEISGTGVAAHLGSLTITSTDCITPMSETTFSFLSQNVVLTTASGEQIFVDYSGTFNINGSVGTIVGGYRITGGTGRFADAEGAGAVRGTENLSADLSAGEGRITLVGTISY
jgi:hypothetical protein